MTNIQWGISDPNAFARGYAQSNNIVGGITNAFRERDIMAEQRRKEEEAKQAAKHERDTKVIATLARDAKDPQTFDQAVDQVVAMGYPEAAQFKGQFSPALRSALMAAGGLEDKSQEAEYVVIDGVAFDKRTRQPAFESPYPKVVSGPGGIYQQERVGFGRQGQPSAVPQGRVISGPEIAPGWELLDDPSGDETPDVGGPTPRASGGFPY